VTGPAVVLTFDPHPLELLRPEQFQPLLTTSADRADLLQRAGADAVVVLHTTPQLLQLEASEFFRLILRDRLGARAVIEGADFRFGRNRTGDVELLGVQCAAAEMGMEVVPPFELDGVVVSSSKVRAALVAGDVAAAAALLGRPYRLGGVVCRGQKRGKSLGFPTANLHDICTLVPGDGVYSARAETDGRDWPAAVNIGPNPTFGEQARKVEAHLIGFDGDLYGRPLAITFLDRLRDTRRFDGIDDLTTQLRQDVARAAEIAGTLP
jgi:riboflavin kinase/FMN adenylyltransferase